MAFLNAQKHTIIEAEDKLRGPYAACVNVASATWDAVDGMKTGKCVKEVEEAYHQHYTNGADYFDKKKTRDACKGLENIDTMEQWKAALCGISGL